MGRTIDVNADVGEGFPFDDELLEIVSSANIACGFHAGDDATMQRLCRRCGQRGVAVGAQVSYRDRAGFGRRPVEIGYAELRADLEEQLAALDSAAATAGVAVAYVKPHGALYSRVVQDEEQARAVVDAARSRKLPVLGLPGSVVLALAREAGLTTYCEFFADRAYTPADTLVARTEPDAVLTAPGVVAERVRELVRRGTVSAVDGSAVAVEADSICVHGDTTGAPVLARAVAAALADCAVDIRRFA